MFPALELAGLGVNIVGGILAHDEAKKRERAMRRAARRMYVQRQQEFNTAVNLVRENQSRYRNDPRRAQIQSMWDDRLANPDVFSPAEISVMKNRAFGQAGRAMGTNLTRMRESAQRAGVRASPMMAGMESAHRMGAYGAASGVAADIDFAAGRANKESRDRLRTGYAGWMMDDLRGDMAGNENLVQLYASKQYDPSTIMAFM